MSHDVKTWRAGGERWWETRFPTDVDTATLVQWQSRVLRSGEDHAVYRVQEVELLGYERSRDGFIGDFLTTNPDRTTRQNGMTIPGLMFDAAGSAIASTVVFVETADGRYQEMDSSDVHDLAYASGVQGVEREQPVEVFGIPGSDPGEPAEPILLSVHLQCTIWFPWSYERFPSDGGSGLIDNTALARHNAPRLNAFLADVRSATEDLGGTWKFGGAIRLEQFQLDDNGVVIDAVPPTLPSGVTWRQVT